MKSLQTVLNHTLLRTDNVKCISPYQPEILTLSILGSIRTGGDLHPTAEISGTTERITSAAMTGKISGITSETMTGQTGGIASAAMQERQVVSHQKP